MNRTTSHTAHRLAFAIILLVAIACRLCGLYRGLHDDCPYVDHPDTPKQVSALGEFLHGNYFWIVHHSNYDGYPLFLNHLDEWIMRPLLAIGHRAHDVLYAENTRQDSLDKIELFTWCRSLRVFYGMLALLLAYGAARRLLSPAAALWTAAVIALAPLSITVSHYAAGDIGLDLFGALTLYCALRHAESRNPGWLLLSGAAVGCAFAAKYQGLLVGLPIAIILAALVWLRDIKWQRIVSGGVLALLSCLAAIAIAIPTFLPLPKLTWKYMRLAMHDIKDYNSSPDFLALPPAQKAWISLHENLGIVLSSLGWPLCALALLGLALATRRLWLMRRGATRPDHRLAARDAVLFAAGLFPFAAIVISLAMKRAIQPFHFSYLVMPLAISATAAVHALWHAARPPARLVAIMLAIAALVQPALKTRQELFFWGREDLLRTVTCFGEKTLTCEVETKTREFAADRRIKHLVLEPEGLAVFRNRAVYISTTNHTPWTALQVAPVPDVPLPARRDYIFLNGPVFPRNDRMLRVPGDTCLSRQLVLYERPGEMHVALRSGTLPVQGSLALGGERRDFTLEPHEQRIVTVTPTEWRFQRVDSPPVREVYIVPLSITAKAGSTWVTILGSDRELENYAVFGGVPPTAEFLRRDLEPATVALAMESARYLDDGVMRSLRAPTVLHLVPRLTALAAGIYDAKIAYAGAQPGTTFTVQVEDGNGLGVLSGTAQPFALTNETGVVRYSFSKPFAPYECTVVIICSTGACRITSSTIRPSALRILDDMKATACGAPAPDWMRRYASDWSPAATSYQPRVRFGDIAVLDMIDYPEQVRVGEDFTVSGKIEVLAYKARPLLETAVFFHLMNERGEQVDQFSCNMMSLSVGDSLLAPVHCQLSPATPPGKYRVRIGMWNTRTTDRLKVRDHAPGIEASARYFWAKPIEVLP